MTEKKESNFFEIFGQCYERLTWSSFSKHFTRTEQNVIDILRKEVNGKS